MPKKYHGKIEISEVRNAVCVSDDGHVDCEINHPQYGWIPYTIAPDDEDMTIDNEQLLDLIDEAGGPAPLTEEARYTKHATFVRIIRDGLLQDRVDPIASNALRWQELDEQQKAALSSYRQSLLDVTEQEGFPYTIKWPDAPNFAG